LPNTHAHTYGIHTHRHTHKKRKQERGKKNKKIKKREGDGVLMGVEERGYSGGQDLILITLDLHECFQFFITCKRTNNANNAVHYVKLGKKRRETSKRNNYIMSLRLIIKAIIIICQRDTQRKQRHLLDEGRKKG